MKRLFSVFSLIMLTVGLSSAQSPLLGQYSADLAMTAMGRTIPGQIYVDNGKVRMEMNVFGNHLATILRPDKKLAYIIAPAQKIIMEAPLSPENQAVAGAYSKDAKPELLATETVKDQVCNKYKIASGDTAVYLWSNKETQVPVLLQSADQKVLVELKNVKKGSQSADLFEPPSGYRTISVGKN